MVTKKKAEITERLKKPKAKPVRIEVSETKAVTIGYGIKKAGGEWVKDKSKVRIFEEWRKDEGEDWKPGKGVQFDASKIPELYDAIVQFANDALEIDLTGEK
jgi:hypothetical protein